MLEPVEHCMDIPKEVCANSRVNPVRKRKPIVKKWCGPDPAMGGEDNNTQNAGGDVRNSTLFTTIRAKRHT